MPYYGMDDKKHHVWCNNHNKPRAGCMLCKEYYAKYPVCNNMEELYFPFEKVKKSVKRRGKAKPKQLEDA